MKLSNLGFFVVRKWVTIMHLPLDYKFLKKYFIQLVFTDKG
jgi:hypothetical protein